MRPAHGLVSPGDLPRPALTLQTRGAAPDVTCHVHLLGGLFPALLRREGAQVSVYNDHDSALSTLFTAVRGAPDALAGALGGERVTPGLARAAQTYQLLHAAWYGHALEPGGLSAQGVLEALRPVHARLSRVLIEHLPWDRALARYDDPRTAFYVDAAQGTPQLVAALATARGRWTLAPLHHAALDHAHQWTGNTN